MGERCVYMLSNIGHFNTISKFVAPNGEFQVF